MKSADDHQPGPVIFLNGTSSSGKTTVAKELQLVSTPVCFHLQVDHLNQQHVSAPWRLLTCLDAFAGNDVVLIGIHCPVEKLDRRERARGNRGRGRAASQIDLVHAQME